jgi:hypothetical protein
MESKAFENEFARNLGLLSKEQQNKVLSYIKSLLKRAKNTNQQELLHFAGSIDSKGIEEMTAAIDAGCEKVDANEW